MQQQEIAKLLNDTVKDDQDLTGLLVFNLPKQEIIASTFAEDYAIKLMQIELAFEDEERRASELVGSDGKMNWVMKSLERKVLFDVRISQDVYLYGETKMTEAPSSAIEDALEIALEVGRLL